MYTFNFIWEVLIDVDSLTPDNIQKLERLNTEVVSLICKIEEVTINTRIIFPSYRIIDINIDDNFPLEGEMKYEYTEDVTGEMLISLDSRGALITEDEKEEVFAKLNLAIKNEFVLITENASILNNKQAIESRNKIQIFTFSQFIITLGQIFRDKKIFQVYPNHFITGSGFILYRWISFTLVPEWIFGTKIEHEKNESLSNHSLAFIERFSNIVLAYDWIMTEEKKKEIIKVESRSQFYRGNFDLIIFYFDIFMIWLTAIFDDLTRLISCFFNFELDEERISIKLNDKNNSFSESLKEISKTNQKASTILDTIIGFSNKIYFIYKYRNIVAHRQRFNQTNVTLIEEGLHIKEIILIEDQKMVKILKTFGKNYKNKFNNWGLLEFDVQDKTIIVLKPQIFITTCFRSIIKFSSTIFINLFEDQNYSNYYQNNELINIRKILSEGFFFPPFEFINSKKIDFA